tara:strand:- start:1568 stop:2335 length:768 start_codon:yes stop_codon:yes gene_type:complete
MHRSRIHDKIYIFDVDGTLTPSRQKMTEEFRNFFKEWSSENIFYLVTGSDLPKMQEQVEDDILEKAAGIFTCCGNQFWKEGPTKQWPTDWRLVYENKFKPPKDLIDFLWDKVNNSMCPIRIGNHIEDRNSMLNFSVVGRDCTQEQREEYYEWDNKEGERRDISRAIGFRWPELDAVIGGQISIDIYPKGYDKSQILEHIEDIEEKYCPNKYIFIGDRTEKGGNDYPLTKLMVDKSFRDFYQTDGPEKTMEILKSL